MSIEDKIRALTNVETFYEDVRHIVGFYEGKFHQDWVIKKLQRVADVRYSELLGQENLDYRRG